MKKALSILLAIVMVLGLVPMQAMAAGTEIGTSANGQFVDETADPDKSYEYTVTGSDGSVATVVVPAANAEPTGNSLTEHTGTGAVSYRKVDAADAGAGIFLLVYNYNGTNYAVSTEIGGRYSQYVKTERVTVREDNTIEGPRENLEYTLENDGGRILFRTGNAYLGINSYDESALTDAGQAVQAQVQNQSILLEDNGWKLIGENGKLEASSSRYDRATQFTLYQKVTEPVGRSYTVGTEGLDALLAESFTQSGYTEESWQTYADARTAAQAAKSSLNNPYTEKTAADAALAEIDSATRVLDSAIKGLQLRPMEPVEPGTCVRPEITWHRTWETGHRNEAPVKNVQHLVDREPWQDITWDWNQVRDLTASDPNPWNANQGTAATWSKGYGGSWTDSSVRRFTGTFIWPEGVGMDGTMTIQSVNDANYQFIYDYINEKDARGGYLRPELQKRYGDAKVLPINDDMYVFISRVSDGEPSTWTRQQAKDRLMFWTGTSGKGIWSQHGNTNADWGRETPAQFEGKNATPAFHGSWPNLVDTGAGTNANVENWDLKGQPNPMTQTDSWYTLTDTNAMKSTLTDLYGASANLAGQEMRIDVFAFDNSADGGMDALELILCPAKQEDVEVTVHYWLDRVDGTDLGTSKMTARVGDTIRLTEGTNSNELNYKRAEAINEVGNSAANVSSGVQQGTVPYVVTEGTNVIDVVYTSNITGITFYTYDFGLENTYLYRDDSSAAIRSVSVECNTDPIGASFRDHDITLTYTPRDALGNPVSATVVVERTSGEINRYPLSFVPASNVLYEDGFIRGGAGWTHEPAIADGRVSDNEDTVFGWTDAYAQTAGANGIYTAELAPQASTAETLTFSFRGRGFDLIGSCGADTGTLLVRVVDHNNKDVPSRNYLVDTSFSGGEIHQVPLVHFMNDAGAVFDVSIAGFNLRPDGASPAALADGTGTVITPAVYEALTQFGLTDEEIGRIEYIGMEEQLNGDRPAVMAAAPAASGKQTVTVDGFRIYRGSSDAENAYPAAEQNMTYTNVLDCLRDPRIAAFVEQGAPGESYEVTEYEAMGGPQNEVYLAAGQSVAIKAGANAGLQISLRNVYDSEAQAAAQLNGTTVLVPGHNTELYYEVPAADRGIVTVQNTGTGLLAIGNVKHQQPLDTVTEADYPAIYALLAGPAQPESGFEVRFDLSGTDFAWADGTDAAEVRSFRVDEEEGGVKAPAVIAGNAEADHWKADEIDAVLTGNEVLTAAYLEENFDWTDTDRVVTFRPVAAPAFAPEHFDIQLTVEKGYTARYVSVNVEASAEVAYLTVNGERVDAANADWVEAGFDEYLIFATELELNRSDETAIEIVAYDADGHASEAFLAEQ